MEVCGPDVSRSICLVGVLRLVKVEVQIVFGSGGIAEFGGAVGGGASAFGGGPVTGSGMAPSLNLLHHKGTRRHNHYSDRHARLMSHCEDG